MRLRQSPKRLFRSGVISLLAVSATAGLGAGTATAATAGSTTSAAGPVSAVGHSFGASAPSAIRVAPASGRNRPDPRAPADLGQPPEVGRHPGQPGHDQLLRGVGRRLRAARLVLELHRSDRRPVRAHVHVLTDQRRRRLRQRPDGRPRRRPHPGNRHGCALHQGHRQLDASAHRRGTCERSEVQDHRLRRAVQRCASARRCDHPEDGARHESSGRDQDRGTGRLRVHRIAFDGYRPRHDIGHPRLPRSARHRLRRRRSHRPELVGHGLGKRRVRPHLVGGRAARRLGGRNDPRSRTGSYGSEGSGGGCTPLGPEDQRDENTDDDHVDGHGGYIRPDHSLRRLVRGRHARSPGTQAFVGNRALGPDQCAHRTPLPHLGAAPNRDGSWERSSAARGSARKRDDRLRSQAFSTSASLACSRRA